jgi:hypothetical protein
MKQNTQLNAVEGIYIKLENMKKYILPKEEKEASK